MFRRRGFRYRAGEDISGQIIDFEIASPGRIGGNPADIRALIRRENGEQEAVRFFDVGAQIDSHITGKVESSIMVGDPLGALPRLVDVKVYDGPPTIEATIKETPTRPASQLRKIIPKIFRR